MATAVGLVTLSDILVPLQQGTSIPLQYVPFILDEIGEVEETQGFTVEDVFTERRDLLETEGDFSISSPFTSNINFGGVSWGQFNAPYVLTPTTQEVQSRISSSDEETTTFTYAPDGRPLTEQLNSIQITIQDDGSYLAIFRSVTTTIDYEGLEPVGSTVSQLVQQKVVPADSSGNPNLNDVFDPAGRITVAEGTTTQQNSGFSFATAPSVQQGVDARRDFAVTVQDDLDIATYGLAAARQPINTQIAISLGDAAKLGENEMAWTRALSKVVALRKAIDLPIWVEGRVFSLFGRPVVIQSWDRKPDGLTTVTVARLDAP